MSWKICILFGGPKGESSSFYNSIIKGWTAKLTNEKKIWIDISPKKTYKWQTHEKMINIINHQGKTKNSIKYHFICTRMAINIKTDSKIWRGCRVTGILVNWCWESKTVHLLRKPIWQFLEGIVIELPYKPITPVLGIYGREMKTLVYTNTCVQLRQQHY